MCFDQKISLYYAKFPNIQYADDISLDSDNVLATLYCSKRYIVPHLAQECIRFLEATLSARNACVLLSQARLFEEPELMQRSWEVIDAQERWDSVY